MESSSYSSKTLDHLGLVAGRCRCTLPPRRNHEEVEKRVFFHFQIVKHAQEYHQ
jgi:hypothetical protein